MFPSAFARVKLPFFSLRTCVALYILTIINIKKVLRECLNGQHEQNQRDTEGFSAWYRENFYASQHKLHTGMLTNYFQARS